MKKILVTLGVILSASLIVVSLLVPVNYSAARLNHNTVNLIADGAGLPPAPPPPPPPQKIENRILNLDGAGLPPAPPPPPPPQKFGNGALPIDGALTVTVQS